MELYDIYALRDPRDGAIRYVGKAKDAKKRLATHLRDAYSRDYPVYRWLRKLLALGLAPTVEVLEYTTDWRETERELIAVLRARGERLLNVADGGDEPPCPVEVRRANGAKVARLRREDPFARWLWESKKTIASGIREGLVSNATRAKLRYAASRRPDLFGCWSNIPDRVEQ